MVTIEGPYLRKDGRKHIVIYDTETKTKKTKSYPKYLMEQYLGRELENWETVDHINGDKTDNRLNNLQILSRKENIQKSSKSTKEIYIFYCSECDSEIIRYLAKAESARFLYAKHHFCSKKCQGKFLKTHYWNGKVKT